MYRHYEGTHTHQGHQGVQNQMSDKDVINDILCSVKHISSHYHQGILEANTHDTRQAFLNLHDFTLDQHKNILETMKSQGGNQPVMANPRYY